MLALADTYRRFSLPAGAAGRADRRRAHGRQRRHLRALRRAGALLPPRRRRDRTCVPAHLRCRRRELHGRAPEAQALADDLGVAMQLTNILRDVREDAENGRVYLPAEELRRFGLIAGDEAQDAPAALVALARGLQAPGAGAVDGEKVAGLHALVRFEVERAHEWFRRGMELAPLLDRRSAACLQAMAGIYRRLLGPHPGPSRAGADRAHVAPGAREGVGRGSQHARRGRLRRDAERVAVAARQARGTGPVERRASRRRDRRRPGGHRGRARLRGARRARDPRRGQAQARRGGLLVRARRPSDRQRPARLPALLRRLPCACSTGWGALERVRIQERLEIPVLKPGAKRAALRRGALPAPLHLAGALARYPHLTPRQRASAARAALALARLDLRRDDLDQLTFGDWLARHGQGPDAVSALWDLVALPTLNLPAARGLPRARRVRVSQRAAVRRGRGRHRLSLLDAQPDDRRSGRASARHEPASRSGSAGALKRLRRTATGLEVHGRGGHRRPAPRARAPIAWMGSLRGGARGTRPERGGAGRRGRDRGGAARASRSAARAAARRGRAQAGCARQLADREPSRAL